MSDDGALESFVAALIGLLLLTMLMFASAFALVNQYQRGRTAADLAAIGAAGGEDPCSLAAEIVQRNHARLIGCAPAGNRLTISVAMPTGLRGLGLPTSVRVTSEATAPDVAATDGTPTVGP